MILNKNQFALKNTEDVLGSTVSNIQSRLKMLRKYKDAHPSHGYANFHLFNGAIIYIVSTDINIFII